MATRLAAIDPVYRHSQDTATNCGRACMQMIVSSLTQAPLSGAAPTPAAAPVPAAARQGALKALEPDPNDVTSQPSWYSHPDELAVVLRGLPALNPPNPDHSAWRVAAHGSFDDLLAELRLALGVGLPAILNIRANDHWVVVAAVEIDSGGVVALELLDPLYNPFNPGDAGHTYMDICGLGADGVTWWQPWVQSASSLASLEVAIGSVPPPPGLASYQGQYVAIVHGASQQQGLLQRVAKLMKARRVRQTWPTASTPAERFLEELRRFGNGFAVSKLQVLLEPVPVPIVRRVEDVAGTWRPYWLWSAYSDRLGYGVMAAFDTERDALLHLRFTRHAKLARSIEGDIHEPLWWTRGFLPSLQSPYFPFRRESHGGAFVYRRALDGEVLTL